MILELRVNQKIYRVEAYEDEPLLWVLRERLFLMATKYGCGIGVCGACTVVMDGKAVRSCLIPAKEAKGRSILTLEGIPSNHPLKMAWIKHQVPQCGYCQPGQIMEAYALLQENPNPSPELILQRMSTHLCRCGTYSRILKAIHEASKMLRR